MRLAEALGLLHGDELDLAAQFDAAADRHLRDADVFHHGHFLASICREHAELLAPVVVRFGGKPDAAEPGRLHAAAAALRRTAAKISGQHETAGVALLDDLCQIHRAVSEVEVSWWIVRQGGLVARDRAVVGLFERCHEETWNQLRWIKTKIKETAPQVLAG